METFSLSITIQQPVESVFEFHYHIENQSSIHPLIWKVERVTEGEDVFRFYEDIPFLFWKIKNVYTAKRVCIKENEHYFFEVKSKPNIEMKVSVYLQRITENTTLLQEKVEIFAPWGMGKFVKNTALAAHQKMFDALKAKLEA
jgi:ligand-binding SRPBCC domain-containing protein